MRPSQSRTGSVADLKGFPAPFPSRPTRKNLEIRRHTFNCKKMNNRALRKGGARDYTGVISHHLRFRPDDQVVFRCTRDGRLNVVRDSIRVNFKRGGFKAMPKGVARLSGELTCGASKSWRTHWE